MSHRALILVGSLCCWGALAVNEEPTEMLRLVGGPGRCQGDVELKHRGEWRRLWPSEPWDLEAGAAVCRLLGCGSAVSTKQRRNFERTDVWRVRSGCVKTTRTTVTDCVDDGFSGSDAGLELLCSDSVRLDSGRSLCSGSLQIRDQSLNQSWTWVCEGALDRRGAEVLCRELGCGAPLLQGALSPLGQMFHCEGNESALMDCPRNQTRTDPGTCPTLRLTCSEPVRLVGGPGRCEGTVEVRYRGEWRRVVPSILYERWDLEAAAAVCRGLDCGSAVSTEEREGFDSGDVWGVRVGCVKTAAVRDCVFSGFSRREDGLEVTCSDVMCPDSVRLVSGRSLCSGSVQIRDQSRSWTSVCEGALDRRGAEVLCRELGCGAPLLQGALSPLGQMFHCEGNESALMDCPRNQTRTDPGTCSTLQLTCSDAVRLVGGASRCEGTVEVRHRGEWKRMESYYKPYVQRDPWDLEAAAAVCRGLDCGSAVSTKRRLGLKASAVWGVTADCVKKTAVRDCVWGGVSPSIGGHDVMCSDSVRLVSGRSLCSGSLQIRDLDRSWTSVCEGALDRRGAEVLCRELGCGAPLLQGALSPLGQTFHCEGHESALMDCPRNQTRTDPGTCSGPALNLSCSDPLRLVGGAGRCEGTLEVRYRGEWKRVRTFTNPWDLEAAGVVCWGLGCGSAVSTQRRGGFNRTEMWGVDSDCVKTKAAVRDCVWEGPTGSGDGQQVVCSGHQGSPESTEPGNPEPPPKSAQTLFST